MLALHYIGEYTSKIGSCTIDAEWKYVSIHLKQRLIIYLKFRVIMYLLKHNGNLLFRIEKSVRKRKNGANTVDVGPKNARNTFKWQLKWAIFYRYFAVSRFTKFKITLMTLYFLFIDFRCHFTFNLLFKVINKAINFHIFILKTKKNCVK